MKKRLMHSKWPEDCLWPEPQEEGFGEFWEAEDAEELPLDETAEELLDIREYMENLVAEGRLNEDYSLNEDYDFEDQDDEEEDPEEWLPELGLEYWDHGFDIEYWEEDLREHLNLLKLPLPSPVSEIQQIIDYEFVNENLLRQAFTRRAFGIEHGVGDSEKLEFIGDAVLNIIVTRELARHMTEVECQTPEEPFKSAYSEGDLSKVRSHYVCREYLSSRAEALGLDKYILFGSGEEMSESSREDMVEALIGAVAADSDWDWYVLEAVVDKLLTIQLSKADDILRARYYDLFNSWHQKHFGQMPEYDVSKGTPVDGNHKEYIYCCTLRYFVPENDQGIWTSQRVDVIKESRSQAREEAAKKAYWFLVNHGLWMRLSDAKIVPDPEHAINQLQELYQKKYVEEPRYEFEEHKDLFGDDEWYCDCYCSGINGWGKGTGKTRAKKKAAYMTLVRLMKSAGICEKK